MTSCRAEGMRVHGDSGERRVVGQGGGFHRQGPWVAEQQCSSTCCGNHATRRYVGGSPPRLTPELKASAHSSKDETMCNHLKSRIWKQNVNQSRFNFPASQCIPVQGVALLRRPTFEPLFPTHPSEVRSTSPWTLLAATLLDTRCRTPCKKKGASIMVAAGLCTGLDCVGHVFPSVLHPA